HCAVSRGSAPEAGSRDGAGESCESAGPLTAHRCPEPRDPRPETTRDQRPKTRDLLGCRDRPPCRGGLTFFRGLLEFLRSREERCGLVLLAETRIRPGELDVETPVQVVRELRLDQPHRSAEIPRLKVRQAE